MIVRTSSVAIFSLCYLFLMTSFTSAGRNNAQLVNTQLTVHDGQGNILKNTLKSSAGVPPNNRIYQDSNNQERGQEGVIIKFAQDSVLRFRARSLGNGRLAKNEIELKVKEYQKKLKVQHQLLQKQIEQHLKKRFSQKTNIKKNEIHFQRYSLAFNGAYLDMSLEEAKGLRQKMPKEIISVYKNTRVFTNLIDSVPMIKADQVWSYTTANGSAIDGTGMRIGVIDTGVDYTHPDLGGCFGSSCKVIGGYDYVNSDSDPMDDHGHGTHVAGTVAGNGVLYRNGEYTPILGVAPGAQIFAYKVLNSTGSGSANHILSAIEACTDPNGDGNTSDHLDVCNMSLGDPSGNPDDPMSIAVDNAVTAGVVFVIAAGNSGPSAQTIGSPGTARKAITVGAACKSDAIGVDPACALPVANFSSQGPVVWQNSNGQSETLQKPDVVAPGHKICAAQWGSAWSESACGPGHTSISGTSMATPHVAGLAALLRQAHPEYTPQEIKNLLMSSAISLNLPQALQGAGLVDSVEALQLSGIPTSLVRLNGLPLAFVDVPEYSIGQLSKTISVTNISTQALSFIPTFATAITGFSGAFNTAVLTLAPNETKNLTLYLSLDHKVIASNSVASGEVILTSTQGVVKISAKVSVLARLNANVNEINLGANAPSLPSWTGQKSIVLKNTSLDLAATYTLSATCCTVGVGGGNSTGITTQVSPTTVTLPPNSQTTVSVSVTVDNSQLVTNGLYSGSLIVSSPLQTLTLPIRFWRGYAVHLTYEGGSPTGWILHKDDYNRVVYFPPANTTESTVYLNEPGPWNIMGIWSETGSHAATFVAQTGIATSATSLAEINLNPATAIHTITLEPKRKNGTPINFGYGLYTFNHRPTDAAFMMSSGIYGTQTIKTSSLSSDYGLAINLMTKDSELGVYQYHIEEGINGSMIFSNTAAEVKEQKLLAHDNENVASVRTLRPATCKVLYNYLGTRYGSYCIATNAIQTNVTDAVPLTFSTYTSSATTNATQVFPDKLFTKWSILNSADNELESTQLYFYGQNTTEHMTEGLNQFPIMTTPFNLVYERNKLDVDPLGRTLLGLGPLADTTAWSNFGDAYGEVRNINRFMGPTHLSGSGSSVPSTSSYILKRNGAQVSAGFAGKDIQSIEIPKVNGLIPSGQYQFELNQSHRIYCFLTQATTVSNFQMVPQWPYGGTPTDSNPPMIQSIHLLNSLIAGGQWSPSLQSNSQNKLTFTVNPAPGLASLGYQSSTGYGFVQMPDGISSVTLSVGPDDGSPRLPVAVIAEGAGKYSALLGNLHENWSELTPLNLYSFQIVAHDMSGNSTSYTFRVPVSPTRTRLTNPAANSVVSGVISLQAVATDPNGISKVEFFNGSTLIGTVTTSPFIYSVNTLNLPNGNSLFSTKAYSVNGDVAQSKVHTLTINNQTLSAALIAPSLNSFISTQLTMTATAQNTSGSIDRVEFYRGTSLLGTVRTAPYTLTVSTATIPNGVHVLTVKAYNNLGAFVVSAPVSITVDKVLPTVTINSPQPVSVVSGVMGIDVSASDSSGIEKVELWMNNILKATSTTSPHIFSVNTATLNNGNHSLIFYTYDKAGNKKFSFVSVVVSNTSGVGDTIAPSVSIVAPSANAIVAKNTTMPITANFSDNVSVSGLYFYVNGNNFCSAGPSGVSTITCNYTTNGAGNYPYKIQVMAIDAAGNVSGAINQVTSAP